MPEPLAPDGPRPEPESAQRSADRAAIERLAETLVPALIAKLRATGLGELEVRQDSWRIRLRRSAEAAPAARAGRHHTDRAPDPRPDRGSDRPGDRPARLAAHPLEGLSARTETRGVATSPAVGIYRPRTDLSAGDRVRAGDRLGAVDMLGVAQEVVAPADGIVGSSLVQTGDAVEYGQELLVIELSPLAAASTNGRGTA